MYIFFIKYCKINIFYSFIFFFIFISFITFYLIYMVVLNGYDPSFSQWKCDVLASRRQDHICGNGETRSRNARRLWFYRPAWLPVSHHSHLYYGRGSNPHTSFDVQIESLVAYSGLHTVAFILWDAWDSNSPARILQIRPSP